MEFDEKMEGFSMHDKKVCDYEEELKFIKRRIEKINCSNHFQSEKANIEKNFFIYLPLGKHEPEKTPTI